MSKKAFKKKKAYKKALYEAAQKGFMNNSDGDLRPIGGFVKNGMVDGFRAGYRLGD